MLEAGNHNPNVIVTSGAARRARGNVRMDVDVDKTEALIRDMCRNPEKYQDQQ